jgi:hypothetical protein
MPFLNLPTELRLNVYAQIIDRVSVPTSANMANFKGLLLSCRQIHQEFESEALKVAHRFLETVQEDWTVTHKPLRLPRLRKLSDTIHITIGIPEVVPYTYAPYPPYLPIYPLVEKTLRRSLPFFTIYMEDPKSGREYFRNVYDLRCYHPMA